MNAKQAHKQAAAESKTEGARYVVYVFDQGQDVYSAEQCRMWQALILVEACYIAGVKVADAEAVVQ